MSETCPSLCQTMAMTSVSVRYDAPGLLSEPISRKLMVSLSVRGGREVGTTATASAIGGAATVGNNWLTSTVAVGSMGGMGVGDAVSVGRMICSAEGVFKYDSGEGCVGVYSAGWNGVGVGDAFGAEVIKINGRGADADACGVGLQA